MKLHHNCSFHIISFRWIDETNIERHHFAIYLFFLKMSTHLRTLLKFLFHLHCVRLLQCFFLLFLKWNGGWKMNFSVIGWTICPLFYKKKFSEIIKGKYKLDASGQIGTFHSKLTTQTLYKLQLITAKCI